MQILIVGAVVGIGFVEADGILQAAFGNQPAAGFNIDRAVVAQTYRVGQSIGGECVENVTAVSGSDVENMYWLAGFA